MINISRKEIIVIPKSLRRWFVIHFLVDMVAAIPLFLMPETILDYFNYNQIDPLMTRLFAAALFGIGIESLLGRNAALETFKNMLNLKIIWSIFAILGIGLTIYQSNNHNNIIAWLGLIIFLIFNFIWVYWKYYLSKYSQQKSQ